MMLNEIDDALKNSDRRLADAKEAIYVQHFNMMPAAGKPQLTCENGYLVEDEWLQQSGSP